MLSKVEYDVEVEYINLTVKYKVHQYNVKYSMSIMLIRYIMLSNGYLVDVETVPGHGVAVVRVPGLPAPGALITVRSRASLRTALSAPRRAPSAVRARCVPVAGVAGGGQRPVVGGDPQATGLPPLRLTGAPLLHGGPALHAVVLAASAV